MSNEKLREALQGFLTAMEQGLSLHLAAEYARQTLATTEPEPTGMPELPEPYRSLDKHLSHPVFRQVLFAPGEYFASDQLRAYGEQCWKAGYKHGAWGGDARDAERYRWLRDDTDSDWAICEWSHDPGDEGYYRDARAPHIVDAAIDAAMAQGVK